ncbi:tyrosine--tRNA ligase [Sneathiella chinensis]|uniref:Tyrosine--tRNA ligase n=1 Tax=Sneathiella chinensis TaxID=349750 RepID=A0ABQ5U6N2_9PROT|nr:tyrosine--tRNA ligase [Sneathiella chinensis]GLQ07553.1 tyrosine--tRNA ligase [Sneathiella chinensis]
MTNLRSDFMQMFLDRGYFHQCTDIEALDKSLYDGPVTAYIGFDCTARSLHVGSLMQIMILRRLQQAGHKPIVLMGGGTTKVGDPTGRDESRPVITDEIIQDNMDGIKKVFEKFITFGDGPTDAIMVNNDDWLSKLEYIPFLREYGRHFSINRMLTFDSVKLRLEREQSMSFLEFNYMILQAYDFVELRKKYGVTLQIGGSDQWGNIVNGTELGRRTNSFELYGLTTPLLTTASGTKMGKTLSGAVWLNEDMLSPYEYWQFWRNTEDADVGKFLRLFTELPLDEIARLEKLEGAELNEAKKVLANECTALAHSREAAEAAAETARKTFELGELSEDLPTTEIPKAELDEGIPAFALFNRVGLSASSSEARKLIKGGGARLNDEKISDEGLVLTSADVNTSGRIKLSAGKKRHHLILPA